SHNACCPCPIQIHFRLRLSRGLSIRGGVREVEDAMKLLAHLTNAIVSTVIVSGALVVLSASVVSAEGRKIPESSSTSKARLQEAYGRLPLSFEANRGQTDPQVRFLSRATGHTLFLAPTEPGLMLRI